MDSQQLSFSNYTRRFGVEIEVNALDGRSRPHREDDLPNGIHYVGNVVLGAVPKVVGHNPEKSRVRGSVECAKWHHTHHNNTWVIKPDGSCGMEVCSPVTKGMYGIKEICRVVDNLAADPLIESDERCSLHLHVEVSDLSIEQVASVLTWWIKCEWVFLHSVPQSRKMNRYCQCIGQSDLFEHDSQHCAQTLINKLGNYKYYSVNTFHYSKNKRPTIEFRIAENEACMDSEFVKNWIILLIHFVEMAKERERPGAYEEGNQWSSFLWLDVDDCMEFLGFNQNIDKDLAGAKAWFIDRIKMNIKSELPGIWEDIYMAPTIEKINQM